MDPPEDSRERSSSALGALKRGDHHALGVERTEHPAHRTVLPRRVPSLQDHQQGRVLRLGVERAAGARPVARSAVQLAVERLLSGRRRRADVLGVLSRRTNPGPRGKGASRMRIRAHGDGPRAGGRRGAWPKSSVERQVRPTRPLRAGAAQRTAPRRGHPAGSGTSVSSHSADSVRLPRGGQAASTHRDEPLVAVASRRTPPRESPLRSLGFERQVDPGAERRVPRSLRAAERGTDDVQLEPAVLRVATSSRRNRSRRILAAAERRAPPPPACARAARNPPAPVVGIHQGKLQSSSPWYRSGTPGEASCSTVRLERVPEARPPDPPGELLDLVEQPGRAVRVEQNRVYVRAQRGFELRIGVGPAGSLLRLP